MPTPPPAASHPGDSPIRVSPILGRPIRQDGLDTLGISTQTLAEDALDAGRWELAAELAAYFAAEIRIMNDVLFTWLGDILDFRLSRGSAVPAGIGGTLLAGFRTFQPGRGDLDRALQAMASIGRTTHARPWS